MAAENPFTKQLPASPPSEQDGAAFAHFGLIYGAEALWDMLAELPGKADAARAQARLQECVFWAGQAMGTRS